MSFFTETCQASLNSSFYSTIFACVASLILVLLTINCGPALQGEYSIPETVNAADQETATTQSNVTLPESATVDLEKQPYVRNAFKQRPGVTSKNALDDFHATSRRTVRHSAVVTNCSFDVLKAFIAKGWAPIVIVQFQGRTPEILALSEYNNQLNKVGLQSPANLTKRQLTYKDFETSWSKISDNKCVLITPRQIRKKDVQNVLGEYLPTEAFQQISIRSR